MLGNIFTAFGWSQSFSLEIALEHELCLPWEELKLSYPLVTGTEQSTGLQLLFPPSSLKQCFDF